MILYSAVIKTPPLNLKGGSNGHNHKRGTHIIILLMWGHIIRPRVLISKGGHYFVISKRESRVYYHKRGGPTL